mgnify:FL=1
MLNVKDFFESLIESSKDKVEASLNCDYLKDIYNNIIYFLEESRLSFNFDSKTKERYYFKSFRMNMILLIEKAFGKEYHLFKKIRILVME